MPIFKYHNDLYSHLDHAIMLLQLQFCVMEQFRLGQNEPGISTTVQGAWSPDNQIGLL